MGLAPAGRKDHYDDYQALFHDNLPMEPQLFNEYHALLDRHAKETCTKTPRCSGCCLRDLCRTGRDWRDDKDGGKPARLTSPGAVAIMAQA